MIIMMKKKIVLGISLLFAIFFGIQSSRSMAQECSSDHSDYNVNFALISSPLGEQVQARWPKIVKYIWEITIAHPSGDLANVTATVTSNDDNTSLIDKEGVEGNSVVLKLGDLAATDTKTGTIIIWQKQWSNTNTHKPFPSSICLDFSATPISKITVDYIRVGSHTSSIKIPGARPYPVYEHTFVASITNPFEAMTDVKAVVTSNDSPNTELKKAPRVLKFGDVGMAGSKLSTNTFTIQQTKAYTGSYKEFPTGLDLTFSPSASAGEDQLVESVDPFVRVYEAVTLDGNASFDTNWPRRDLTYNWEVVKQPAGSNVTAPTGSIADWTFTPEVPGVYVFKLTVDNGVLSNDDTVTIGVAMPRNMPEWP